MTQSHSTVLQQSGKEVISPSILATMVISAFVTASQHRGNEVYYCCLQATYVHPQITSLYNGERLGMH